MPRLADVARRSGPAYLARYGAEMLPSHRRVLHDLVACRTAALGGHVTQCDQCQSEHYVYHSCRNRSCPTCHGPSTAAWVAARERELLPVPYFHVVFTLPSELRPLVRAHQRVLLGALMATAGETLQALAADPHYVGGTLGILAVLHTWTRALVYHPHVHCLVPGGALSADGQTWRAARGHFLLPVRALSVRFRARFLARVRAAIPEATIPPPVWTKPWVVYCKPTVQGSERVLQYLARYVHRVAITDARILAADGDRVTFRYVDSHTRAWRTMTLAPAEFLRRYLQHVLPRGFHKVRYYGLWSPRAADLRARVHATLAVVVARSRQTIREPSTAKNQDAASLRLMARCPACGVGSLRVIRRLARENRPWTSAVLGQPP